MNRFKIVEERMKERAYVIDFLPKRVAKADMETSLKLKIIFSIQND